MAEKKKKTAKKSRAFTFELYPDSCKGGYEFKKYLDEFNVNYLVSPLHNKDINDDGTKKKEHFHVVLIYDNTTTTTNAEIVVNELKGVRPPDHIFCVQSLSGISRYLIHRDNPEKAQYSASDVIAHGVSYMDCCCSKCDELATLDEIKSFIKKYRVVSYFTLTMYCQSFEPTWYYLLNTRFSYNVIEFQKSMLWTLQQCGKKFDYDNIIDYETGAILFNSFA